MQIPEIKEETDIHLEDGCLFLLMSQKINNRDSAKVVFSLVLQGLNYSLKCSNSYFNSVIYHLGVNNCPSFKTSSK